MDIIQDCLSLAPVPYLSTAFKIFRSIWASVRQLQANQRQLQALAQCIAQLLRTLDVQYKSGRLNRNNTTASLNELSEFLREISAFIEKQTTYGFLKQFIIRDQIILAINTYQQRITTAVASFQISALLDIGQWQRLNSEARKEDQHVLHLRLSEFEANQHQLLRALDVQQENVMAIMCTLQRISDRYASRDPESIFISDALQVLSTWSGRQVTIESWTITPFEVEFGPMIGCGGFAKVYHGIWNHTKVAVKLFKTNASVTPNQQDITREVKIWSELRHPNVIEFFGANVLDDSPFVVMPFYKNGNARNHVRDNPRCDRLKMVHEMSRGLTYLHSRKIVHGDIKAVNVLISDTETAILCDFGLSRMKIEVTTRTTVQDATVIIGSRNWMAPERLMGRLLKPPADIYAFSMTIYELYTGETPLGDANPVDLRDLVVNHDERPERPDDCEGQIPDSLWQLAERCWAKDPRSRPSASAICEDIAQLLVSATPVRQEVNVEAQVVAGTPQQEGVELPQNHLDRTGELISQGNHAGTKALPQLLRQAKVHMRQVEVAEPPPIDKISLQQATVRTRQVKVVEPPRNDYRQACELASKGKYAAAETLLRQMLDQQGSAEGNEHPDTHPVLDKLANVLRFQRRYADSEELYRRLLEGQEKLLGKEHITTLLTRYNLACVLRERRTYAESEEHFRGVLEGREKVLGKEHADTLLTVYNLGGVLWDQHRYAESGKLFRRALEGQERVLGKEHAETQKTRRALAQARIVAAIS